MSEENKNSDKETFDKMFDKVLEIAKVSYDQENDRSKQLLNKSDYLIKYISTITIFVNIFLPLAFTNKVIDLKILIVMYVIISVPLILSLFFSIRAQILKPGKFFPTGKTVLQEIKKNKNDLNSALKIKNRFILYYSSSTEELQSSNDDRARILKFAYKQYIYSILILVIVVFVIMILIA